MDSTPQTLEQIIRGMSIASDVATYGSIAMAFTTLCAIGSVGYLSFIGKLPFGNLLHRNSKATERSHV